MEPLLPPAGSGGFTGQEGWQGDDVDNTRNYTVQTQAHRACIRKQVAGVPRWLSREMLEVARGRLWGLWLPVWSLVREGELPRGFEEGKPKGLGSLLGYESAGGRGSEDGRSGCCRKWPGERVPAASEKDSPCRGRGDEESEQSYQSSSHGTGMRPWE